MLCGQPQIVQKKTHVTPPWRRRGRSGNVLEIPLHADRERLDPSGKGVGILFPNIKTHGFHPLGPPAKSGTTEALDASGR